MIKLKDILQESIIGDKVQCDNCDWNWKIADGGDDLYMCHKCGHDNTPKLQDILKSIPNQEIIESEDGQWEYPGRITRIPSNRITMQPNPLTKKPIQHILLIIGDQSGENQIGIPGGPDMFFPNDKSVTEYPIKRYK